MSWKEYVLKSFAYHRMQKDKWQHTRFIAYRTTIAPYLNPKFIPKNIEQFMPLGEKIQSISDTARKNFLEASRKYYENKRAKEQKQWVLKQ